MVYLAEIWDLDFQIYQNEKKKKKKKTVAELDHNDLLPVYECYFAKIPISH